MSADAVALLSDLEGRGLVQEHTDRAALAARLAEGPLTLYYGCDPTADSLHVGNLIGLLVLRRFQAAGHRPIALAGGATGMIGDPGGRSEERNLLDEDTLAANVAAIEAQIGRVVGSEQLVDNRDWTAELRLVDFLRDVGKHVTINQMVARESVRARLESEAGISFTEFSYMLLQANDYLWLHDHHGCELQIGGSDQWGNILSGVDLIRRKRGRAVHGFSWPLLTAADGTKLGKTMGARVWLDPARTSPYQFFQHFIRTDDRQVRLFLAQFTLLPLPAIDELVADHQRAPEQRVAQRRLAREVTALVHGPEQGEAAEAASEVLFGGSLDQATESTWAMITAEVPTAAVGRSSLEAGIGLVDGLRIAGLAASNGEARRTIAQGGAYVNNERADEDRRLGPADLRHDRYLLLRRGRREYAVLEVG